MDLDVEKINLLERENYKRERDAAKLLQVLLFFAAAIISYVYYSVGISEETKDLATIQLTALPLALGFSVLMAYMPRMIFKQSLKKTNADSHLPEIDLHKQHIKAIVRKDIKAHGNFTALGYWKAIEAMGNRDHRQDEQENETIEERYPQVFDCRKNSADSNI